MLWQHQARARPRRDPSPQRYPSSGRALMASSERALVGTAASRRLTASWGTIGDIRSTLSDPSCAKRDGEAGNRVTALGSTKPLIQIFLTRMTEVVAPPRSSVSA